MVRTKVERVRFTGAYNLCVIMPEVKGPEFADNERRLEVDITLQKDHMMQLKQNELLNKLAEWIGK